MAVTWSFTDNRIEVENALADAIESALLEVSAELVSQVKSNSRVDTSQLKGSWKSVVEETVATIGSPLENAIWEEFGTGEYALHGDGRKGAWYVPVDGYTGKKRPTYNGQVVIVYGKNKKKYYKTNGKKPSRAFWNAYTTLKPAMIKHMKESIGADMK